MRNELKEYLDGNQSNADRTHLMALESAGEVYGIEVRFPNTLYECSRESFAEMKAVLNRRSGGALRITSSRKEFKAGIISIKVGFCNHGYSHKKAAAALQFLIGEILPSLNKAKK